tara:strand:- start:1210 stop:1494 length:285 start_codon:yes stop_codon:yes gene_type:complete
MSAKAEYKVMSGDEVVILAGEHRGSTAKVVRFVNDGDRVELEVDGLEDDDKVIKHQRRSQEFPNGTRLFLNPTVHVSNVMKKDRWDKKRSDRAN